MKVESVAAFAAIATAVAGVGATPARAQEFSQAELFFELNHTDGDLGIHAAIDGEPYQRLEIEDPRERQLLVLSAFGRLARQGLTQLALESAEPSFDEFPPDRFFRRFPEGTYQIGATTADGEEVEAEVTLSHVLAAPPDGIRIAGFPAAESCDAPVLPLVSPPVVIDWEPVVTSHPEIGRPGPVAIVRYELFVEGEAGKLSLQLPPETTEFPVPAELLVAGAELTFEILARTSTGNQTAIESCFVVQ